MCYPAEHACQSWYSRIPHARSVCWCLVEVDQSLRPCIYLLCSFDLAFYHLSYFHSVIAVDGSSLLRLIIPSVLSARSGLSICVSLYNWLLSILSNSTWSRQTYQPQKFWILLSRWDTTAGLVQVMVRGVWGVSGVCESKGRDVTRVLWSKTPHLTKTPYGNWMLIDEA